MIPHTAFTLNAVCISQRAHTGMCAQTFPAVAHPSFTEVTYCPLVVKKKCTKIKDFATIYFLKLLCGK